MVENLRTSKYNSETTIPNVSDSAQWSNLTKGGCIMIHMENCIIGKLLKQLNYVPQVGTYQQIKSGLCWKFI